MPLKAIHQFVPAQVDRLQPGDGRDLDLAIGNPCEPIDWNPAADRAVVVEFEECMVEQFDPARHEAVATVNDPDTDPGTIVHVVHPGYGEGEHQLRPAAVVVATKGP